MPVQVSIIFFAVIAAFILYQLYNVLGKKVGRQPQEDAKGTALPGPDAAAVVQRPALDPVTLAAISGLRARDPAFDPQKFVEGARQAYETIVRGYASGDRAALKPLLAEPVMDSFETGIAARETRGETEQIEFLQSPRADLENATVVGDRAVAKVRFLAEIRSRILPVSTTEVAPIASEAASDAAAASVPATPVAVEGAQARIEERRTAEHWTFERALGAADPNWVLARVEPANA